MSSGFGPSMSDEGFAAPDYDELAELFLGGEGGGAEAPRSAGSSEGGQRDESLEDDTGLRFEGVEALILGHLPVRAGPWVGQYAAAAARNGSGTVGLVRLSDGVVTLDLYGDGGIDSAQFDGFEDALRRCSAVVDRWIVQVQELDEPALACDPRVGAVTLLAGANEAAIVAAYRTIKGLSAGAGVDGLAQIIGVAIMGADETQAQTALARLRRASNVFLDREVVLAATVSQMQPTGMRAVYRSETSIGPDALLGQIHSVRTGSDGVDGPYPFDVRRAAEHAGVDFDTDAELEIEVRRPAVEAFETHVAREERVFEAPALAEPVMNGAASTGVLELETLLEGLFPFAARCPDDESVRLAIGSDGTLHLLRRDDDGKGIEPLVAVEAWARKHAKLLAMAAGGAMGGGMTQPIQRHLFTGVARGVRHLLDTDAQVHLLASVEVGGSSGWYCTELN